MYSILIGTDNGVVREKLTGGFTQFIRVPPSRATLEEISRASGGQLFSAPNDERLENVYERLGSRLGRRRESREVTDYFAGGAAVLLFAGGALSALLFRRVP